MSRVALSYPDFRLDDLSDDENNILNACVRQLSSKARVNDKRSQMYEGKYRAQHLGIAVPPQLEQVETTLMWPAKAVEALEALINLEGFVVPDGTAADYGIDRIWRENRLGIEATQAHTSALKYGVSFIAVLAGGPGEPGVVIRNLSPTSSTALWDSNRRQASAALTVTASENGLPTEFILFLPDRIITASKNDKAEWEIEDAPHTLGRCPVAVLPFKPSVEEPFGRSRITRGVMTITERVARTLLRMEISAEFYSAPQRYLLGAPEGAFVGADGVPREGWQVTLGRMLAIPSDEDGNNPTIGQFQQMTMQPHVDMVRSDAALFAGETNIPVSALGIIHDNPASDAAMQSAYMALYGEAERAWEPFGAGWVDAILMAIQIRDGSVPEELAGLRAKWSRVDTPTMAARGDYVMKQVQTFPWMADSDVPLEESGYDQTTIERLRSDRRRGQVSSLVNRLTTAAPAAAADPDIATLAANRGNSSTG